MNIWRAKKVNANKTILIGISPFGNVISDYFKLFAEELKRRNYEVILIFDQNFEHSSWVNQENIDIYSWPSKRPTKFSDFYFFLKLTLKYQPLMTISNFGSTNLMAIVSWMFRVKFRINYIHTQQRQLLLDSKEKKWYHLLKFRKEIVYTLHTHFLTNSNGTRIEFYDQFPRLKIPCLVSPYLLESREYFPKNQSRRYGKILIVGRLSPSKGHKLLFKQFKYLFDFDPSWHLVLIGTGSEFSELQKLSLELGIADSVKFMGNMSNEAVCREFSSSIISISPSFSEAFGIVNVESMRAGTPIIMTKTAGGLDIIEEHINGEFMDKKNPYSLLEAVNRIMLNWDVYSKNSMDFYNKKFHGRNIAHQIDELEKFLF